MKLSEKGFKALLHKVRSGFFWGYEDDIHKAKYHDFKPDDFKGVVCLTVEEAEDLLGWLHNSQWKHHTDLEYAEDWQRDWIRYLKERIEQAEKDDE